MTKEDFKTNLRNRLGLSSRIGKVTCYKCGKALEIPQMYSEKERETLTPYCPTATVLINQWLIYHGWHVTRHESNPPAAFFCPDCFPKDQPEYSKSNYCEVWCQQANAWMNKNDKR